MRAIVLAAGKGKRLHSERYQLPKVLREANGRPLIEYVLDSISFIEKKDIVIVTGFMREKVMTRLGQEYTYIVQDPQLGTGHAVACAREAFLDYDGDVLILYGDMPLVRLETYETLIRHHQANSADCTLLTAKVDEPASYGRIVRDVNGNLADIVEYKDATPEQKKITEVNVGIYVFRSRLLFEGLRKLKNNNAQNEYYLTDIPKIFINEGRKVLSHIVHDSKEACGVNTEDDLKYVEKVLSKRDL